MRYMDDKGDEDVGDSGGGGRGVSDDVLENKFIFDVLRRANTRTVTHIGKLGGSERRRTACPV